MFNWFKRKGKDTPPPAARPEPAPAEVAEISVQELRDMLAAPDPPLLIDVREAVELALGVIPGSTHMPMNTIPRRLDELPGDRPIVAYCAVGQRSYAVAEYLLRQGFRDVRSLEGGIVAWAGMQRAGR